MPAPHSPVTRFLTDPGAALTRPRARRRAPPSGLRADRRPRTGGRCHRVRAGTRSPARVRRHAAYLENARVITVLAPPKVDPRSAEALWSHLLGLLRPPRTRFLRGQPHLAFEYAWSRAGLQVRSGFPGTVPPRTDRAGGDRCVARCPDPHRRHARAGGPRCCRAGRWPREDGCASARRRCCRSRPSTTPTRCARCCSACSGLGEGEFAAVQVLARPVTGRRARNAPAPGDRAERRRQRRRDRRPRCWTCSPPERGPPATIRPGRGRWRWTRRRQRPFALPRRRRPAGCGTCAFCTPPPPPSTASRMTPRGCGAGAHQVASAFSVYAGANWFARKKLAHSVTVLGSRAFHGRGDLLSAAELGAVAHLPTDAGAQGLERAGARRSARPRASGPDQAARYQADRHHRRRSAPPGGPGGGRRPPSPARHGRHRLR